MSLSAEQLEIRKGKVMASDVAAYLGFNPHASAFNAWALNLGKDTFEGNPATDAGNFLEEGLLKLATHRLGFGGYSLPGTVFKDYHTWAGCTPDGIFGHGEGIQIKVHGLHQAKHFKGQPGDADWHDNDLIPEWHLCQVLWEMWVCEVNTWWLGCHFGGGDFRLYHINRDDGLLNLMVDRAHDFWKKHLDPEGPQEPPPIDGSDAASDYLRRAFPRNNGNMLAESPEGAAMWAERYHESHVKGKEYAAAKSEAQNHLIAMLGEQDGIEGICTFKAGKPKDKTDWELVAHDIWRDLNKASINEVEPLENYITSQTTTPEPSRRFNLKWKPEQG